MSRKKQREAIVTARAKVYGDYKFNHSNTGRIWAGILSAHLQKWVEDIPGDVVAAMMTAFKVERSARPFSFKQDDFDDAANYLEFSEVMAKARKVRTRS
jgi:hypothetical protein